MATVPRQSTFDCAEPVNFRARYGRAHDRHRRCLLRPEAPQRVSTEIAVRDIFIAGLGDSIASGEGNPDRPIALVRRRLLLPLLSRHGLARNITARAAPAIRAAGPAKRPDSLQVWQRQSALWFNSACHRSLYSYQTRTALALAVQYPHIAVTYLPLACTGATIADGLFGSQHARECPPTKSGANCSGTVNAQLAELREAVTAAKRRQPDRRLDLVLLSIGANDINFSGLVADVIVDSPTERALFRRSGVMGSVDDSRAAMTRDLPQGFAKLREALKPLVGDMSRVVYVSYANPTLARRRALPRRTRRLRYSSLLQRRPAAARQRLELCAERIPAAVEGDWRCARAAYCAAIPAADRMTFVDAHQAAFADHGFCARAPTDPEFDRACFSAKGESFDPDIVTAASQPMLCGRSASEYRAYLPRARWIRDANDSYFAAMTYPGGLPASSQPSDIHDATWGVLSAVYGGAVHPSAEGHAAMADAALPAAASVLQLDAEAAAPIAISPVAR